MDPNTKAKNIGDGGSGNNSKPRPPASCTLCRHRKVKCDRTIPCGHCVRSGAECVPFTPSRAPRGRQGGRKRKRGEDELLERIAKLEGMVKHIEGHGSALDEHQTTVPNAATGATTYTRNEEPSVVAIRSQTRNPGMDRYLASSFWVNLSEEINGLKDVLGGSSEEDSEDDDEQTPSSASQRSGQQNQQPVSHSGFVISRMTIAEDLVHPTHHQVYTFCEIYLANVDPVFKILHAPSVRRFLQGNSPQLDCSPGLSGIEALRFAIYYAAVTSMAEGECKARTGEEKGILLARFRLGIEEGLANADFVNTVDMSTLQALSIFLVTVRSNDTSRLMWTLTSIAIRIAEAMGLHRESTMSSLCPFDREMRRRLWWQLCDLDSHAAEDRASTPLIFANSFNTRLPLQINDLDISPDTLEEPKEAEGFTDMTFTLSCNEMFHAVRRLNHVPARELGSQQDGSRETWGQRIDTVVSFQRSMEQQYLRHLVLTRPFHWFTRQVADIVTAIMWLFVYRPLQKLPDSIASSQIADPGILRIAIDVLERAHQLVTDPAASPFRWLSQTYVQWHALAVMAAELCVKIEGPMVEKAWTIVEPAFTEIAQHVADSNKGMLWRPIKKLMSRARGVRQQQLNSRSAVAEPSVTAASLNRNNQTNPQGGTGEPTFDLDNYAAGSFGALEYQVQNIQQAPPMPTSVPFDWDPWLTAATAATTAAAAPNQFNNGRIDMAWTNWEDFINDFQGQDDVVQGPSGLGHGSSDAWP